jgi:hypothetical protein
MCIILGCLSPKDGDTMLNMASSWLVKQWKEVSGNVKFGVLLLLGTGIMSGATALTHRLETWQQIALVALFAVMFCWALIATFVARRQKQGGFIVTQENLESYVRQWLDDFHVTVKKLPKNDQLAFAYQVDYEDGTHVTIFHPKERYQYLAIEESLRRETRTVRFTRVLCRHSSARVRAAGASCSTVSAFRRLHLQAATLE